MRLINRYLELVKRVTYFGIELEVPEWARYLATDKDGETFAFKTEPEIQKSPFWIGEPCRMICTVDLLEMDWEDTLVELE